MRVASTITPGGVGVSPWLPLDSLVESGGSSDGVYTKVSGAATYTIEVTPDNIFDPAVTPVAYPTGVAALTGASANQAAGLPFASRAVRVNQSAGAGTVQLFTVLRGMQ